MSMAYDEYMKQVVKPMRAELTQAGFQELLSEEEVEQFIETNKGTSLVVINSVCGCAAGLARPAATQAVLAGDKKPDQLITVFAGQDKAATARMREFFGDIEPSSPSMALIKDNKVVHFIPRYDIEGNSMEAIKENLVSAFELYC